MLLRRTAAAAVGLLALLPTLTACGDDGAELAVGDVVPARESDQFANGSPSFLVLPTGRLEVQLGEPITELAPGDTRELSDVEAPGGSTFVPITWQYDAGTFGEWADYLGDPPSPVIDLLSDGAEYRVPAPPTEGRGSSSFYLLVSGTAKELSLRVDFDGVVQSVDLVTGKRDEGRAAALYDLEKPRRKLRACNSEVEFPKLKGGLADYRCRISRVTKLPYAAGAWAEPGRTWLAVEVQGSLKRYASGTLPGPIGNYLPETVTTQFRVGKKEPAGVYPHPDTLCPNIQEGGCTDAAHIVIGAKAKERPKLVMDQRYQLLLVSEWGAFKGKEKSSLRATATVKLS